MANVGTGAVKIIDDDNDVVGVTGNALDVHLKTGVASIDIGDVSLLLGGTAADTNNGTAGAQTLRVTIASDTTGVLSIDDNGSTISIDDGGGAITVDGTVTANLSATDNAVLDSIASAVHAEDAAHNNTDKGIPPLAVRRNVPASTAVNGDYISLSTDSTGHLYVTEGTNNQPDTFPMLDVDNGFELLSVVSSGAVGVISNCVEIFLQADESNTGYIIVGDGDAADNRGMKLNPGDTIILNITDTRSVGLWASADNQGLRCMIYYRAS